MDVGLLDIGSLLASVSDLEFTGLVIGTVAAGDEFLVFTLEGEPGFEIVLLGSGVVESSRDDGDDAVGEAEGLVEFFGETDHFVEVFP